MSARNPHRFEKDPNLIEDFPIKSYGCHETIIEVCHEMGIECMLVRPDTNEDFLVIHIVCTYSQKKAAQIEWCARMAVGGVKESQERRVRLRKHFDTLTKKSASKLF